MPIQPAVVRDFKVSIFDTQDCRQPSQGKKFYHIFTTKVISKAQTSLLDKRFESQIKEKGNESTWLGYLTGKPR